MSDHDNHHSSDVPSDAEIRALRQLVNEAKTATPPPIDWDGVEERLMLRIEADGASRARHDRHGGRWGTIFGMAAAAAALVALISNAGGDTSAPDAQAIAPMLASTEELVVVPGEAAEAPTYAIRGMRPHTAIESGAEAMRFTLPGVVDWTLAPNSRVVVEAVPSADAVGQFPHVVRLERGRIEAAVVPRNDSNQLVEAFVIEAGATRVAVHGTRFSVARNADVVDVEVTRGTVTVGPARHRGATTGHLLVSPRRATFRAGALLDSDALARIEPSATADAPHEAAPAEPTEVASGDAVEAQEAAEPAPVAAVTGGAKGEPAAPTTEDDTDEAPEADEPTSAPALTVAQARGRVVSCLAGAASDDPAQGTKVTVSSQVTAVLGKAGEVLSVQFSPPLRPDLQQRCAGALFGQTLDATGKVSFPVQVHAE